MPVRTSGILAIDVIFNWNCRLWPQTGNQCFLLSFIIYLRVSMWCDVIILYRYPKYAIMAYTIMSLHLYWGEWEIDWFFRILCRSPEYVIDHNTISSILLCEYFFSWEYDNLGYSPSRLKKKRGSKNNVVTPVASWPPNLSQFLASNNIVKIENLAESFYRHAEYVIVHLTIKF